MEISLRGKIQKCAPRKCYPTMRFPARIRVAAINEPRLINYGHPYASGKPHSTVGWHFLGAHFCIFPRKHISMLLGSRVFMGLTDSIW